MPPAICQLYAAVPRDMPIKHPDYNKDLEHSGHRKHSVHPLLSLTLYFSLSLKHVSSLLFSSQTGGRGI